MNDNFIKALEIGLKENKCELADYKKEGEAYYIEVNVLDDAVNLLNIKVAVMFAMYSNGLEEAVSVKVNKEGIKDFVLDPLGATITFIKIVMGMLTAAYGINMITVRSYNVSIAIAAVFLMLGVLITLQITSNKKKNKK